LPKDRAPDLESAARDKLLRFADAAQKHAAVIMAGIAAVIGAIAKLGVVISDHLYWFRPLAPQAPRIIDQIRKDPTGVIAVVEDVLWLPLVAVAAITAYLVLLVLAQFACRLVANYHKGVIAGVTALLNVLAQALKLFT
jgi:hypothetical protein